MLVTHTKETLHLDEEDRHALSLSIFINGHILREASEPFKTNGLKTTYLKIFSK